MGERASRTRARYELALPLQFGTLHQRMKYLLLVAEQSLLWQTNNDVWQAIHDLATEVSYHEPAIPPFGQRPCQE